ncbi:DUF2959 family protein [Balneolaceae bacterium YR4-1]|uniref:DUF2959 family protein n=1 Tax=Halalkalibaculum roseum TaxID=2709311 RepID=A0A6M1SS44_9BACT|nr:DUF2959 family protein [Halalkalibaculum roseum]NGP75650.1 DUF2959 family protein [Halalkalibaculum roseum]
MKLLNHTYTWSSVLLIIAAFGITSCATTGMQRSEDTRTTMETMENDIQKVSRQLDTTGTSLEALMRPGQTDVKQAFDAYSNNVVEMLAMEKKFAKHAEEMRKRGIDYFEEWKKEGTEYDNPEIQKLSNERRAALGDIYDKIAENSIGVNEAFKAYVSDLKEIQTFLSNDLTTKGIAAIGPTSKKVVTKGNNLHYAIQNVQTAIQNARAEMSQSGTN